MRWKFASIKFWKSLPKRLTNKFLEEFDMLYPPVAELLKNVQSRYLLVNVVASRARQIAVEAEELDEELTVPS